MTSPAQAPALRIERIGAFLLVTFNQPEQRNPLGPEVVAGLYQALDTAEADAGIRALAIRGAGPVFCAGGNLGNFADRLAAPPDTDGGARSSAPRITLPAVPSSVSQSPSPKVHPPRLAVLARSSTESSVTPQTQGLPLKEGNVLVFLKVSFVFSLSSAPSRLDLSRDR